MGLVTWGKRRLRRLGIRSTAADWVVVKDNPTDPDVLPSFGFFAILGTWMEGDIVASTVKNAFAQGCDRVYLVDNDSPDNTVEAALVAGAQLAQSFSTDQYDERLRIRLMNETVDRISAEAELEHVWWLWLDADEFPHGPDGLTLREMLASLDRKFRIVGSRYFNHFPARTPESLPGFHPLDLQPLCEELRAGRCSMGHRKHHLQRYDRSGPPIWSRNGFHQAESDETLIEPRQSVFTHHFPYRQEAVTRRRLEELCRHDGRGFRRVELYDREVRRNRGDASDIARRFATLGRVYAQQWSLVENLRDVGKTVGVAPRRWSELVDPTQTESARWYGPEELDAAVAAWRSGRLRSGADRA